MNHTRPLLVEIFDTVSESAQDRLAKLLSRNGVDLFVESVHTAAASSGHRGTYHWVTVIYRKAI